MFFFILPLVYMFQCRLIKKGSNTWYYHFIIPTAMLILLLPSIAMNSQSKLSMYNEQGLKDPVWIILFYFVFALYYTIKTFVVNKTHKANLLNVTANNDIELHLFSNRMVYMSSILIIAIPISLAMQYADFKTLLVDKVLFICFSFIPHFILISLLTFRSFTFTNEWNTHVKEHSDMEESKLEQLCSELTHFMQRHQPYLSQDLSLQVLANSMNWNRSNLSMVINKGFGKNFYDFINEYRLNAVIEKLNNKAFEVYSLDYLVSESGFKNYVSFYRIFKKVKNTTPKNYIEQLRDQ